MATNDTDSIPDIRDEKQPKSFQIAERAGFKKDSSGFLRPEKNSDIAEKFGHSKNHNEQSYVKPANKPETIAFVCGGSEYTLGQFASILGYRIEDFQKKKFSRQHEDEIPLKTLSDAHFRYFIEHGIQDPKGFLPTLGLYFTTLENGKYEGSKAFVFPYANGDGFKYFILDDVFQVIDKRTSSKGKETAWPSPQKDNDENLFIFEGFADCLKARELGYNAFTYTGGVQGTGNIAPYFKPKDRTVYLTLDRDEPSQKALLSVATAFLKKGHKVKIVALPFEAGQGKDFCDWMQKFMPKEFIELIDKMEPFIAPPETSPKEETQDIFWHAVQSKKPDKETGEYSYSLKIRQTKLLDFVKRNGFAPMFLLDTNESIFIRVQENIVEEVNPHKIKEFVLSWVDNLEWELPADSKYPCAKFTRHELRETIVSAENVYFSKTKLQCIISLKPKFNRDTRKEAFFYFKDGFVKVTKDEITLHPYSELDGAIWMNQIIQRNFTKDHSRGEYENFLGNVSNKEPDRILALSTAIGYLLHRFKDPSNAKAIVLLDEKIADNPEGGTGKSLIAKSIGQLRNITKIDGKDFDFNNRFAFQDVGLDSDLVVFDDIEIKFKFERLFHKITDGLETERKGQHRIKRKFEDSPKYLLTTNYTLQGYGGSAERRKVEYELFNHYSKAFGPREEVGHNFFEEWNETEWARFDSFMTLCVQLFFDCGLKTYKHKNLDQRKIVQETSQEFFEFMEDYFFQIEGIEKREFKTSLLDEKISIPEMMENFCSQDPDAKKRMEKGLFTQKKFTMWLKIYAKHSGLKVETGQKLDSKKGKRFYWISFSK